MRSAEQCDVIVKDRVGMMVSSDVLLCLWEGQGRGFVLGVGGGGGACLREGQKEGLVRGAGRKAGQELSRIVPSMVAVQFELLYNLRRIQLVQVLWDHHYLSGTSFLGEGGFRHPAGLVQ